LSIHRNSRSNDTFNLYWQNFTSQLKINFGYKAYITTTPKYLAMKDVEVTVQAFPDLYSLDGNEKLALSSTWELPRKLKVPERKEFRTVNVYFVSEASYCV
jgi:hypothetical protein